MIVRRIKAEEFKRCDELFKVAFEFPEKDSRTADEIAEKIQNAPDGRGEKFFTQRYAAFEDDDKTMMSFFVATPYDVNFDGNVVKMTGIGGVSTLPQYRRNGCIRAIFTKSINDMYNEGYDFSYLYPFSTGYYRQFGYELCGEVTHYYIDLRSYKRFPDANGKCVLIEHGSNLEDVKKVYDSFKQGYNMMVEREDIDYRFVTKASPAEDGNYVYLYLSESGEPKGVMSFQKEKKDGAFIMRCKEFFFSDIEGFKGLLNHALAFSSYYKQIVFRLPQNINITSYIGEWALYPYMRESYFNGMVRVINVANVLKMAKYKGDGEIVLKINDNILPQNNHSFEIVFRNGSAVTVSVSDKKADIELSIADFSRLIVGTHDVEELKYMDSIKTTCCADLLSKIFYKKRNFVADYF